jgi:NTE family protein
VTERALVLGGGGVAGIAWTVGLVCGLADGGVDLSRADLVVGTSAGSVVGALVAGGVPPADLWAGQVDPSRQADELYAEVDLEASAELVRSFADAPTPEALRARLGAVAIAAKTVSEARRRDVIASRLRLAAGWPPTRLLIPAVDAETGAARVFDATDGLDLVDVVAASCAVPGVWPPVTIDGRRYVDGGVRTLLNADLAAGAARVLVLAPTGVAGSGPVAAGLEEALPLLEKTGRVLAVAPDQASLDAMGTNVLDPATREPAATAGRAQAAKVVAEVRQLWS